MLPAEAPATIFEPRTKKVCFVHFINLRRYFACDLRTEIKSDRSTQLDASDSIKIEIHRSAFTCLSTIPNPVQMVDLFCQGT